MKQTTMETIFVLIVIVGLANLMAMLLNQPSEVAGLSLIILGTIIYISKYFRLKIEAFPWAG